MRQRDQPPLRAVRRAEDFYTPPPGQPAGAWDAVPPAERVIAYVEQAEQRTYPRPGDTVSDTVLFARVDAGRWVAQCPDCQSAQVVSPADPRMWCVQCLPDAWAQVKFPEDPEQIEAECADEPNRDRRFWWAPGDPAWNRPPGRRQLTAKEQALADQTRNGGADDASGDTADLGSR